MSRACPTEHVAHAGPSVTCKPLLHHGLIRIVLVGHTSAVVVMLHGWHVGFINVGRCINVGMQTSIGIF